MTDFKTASEVRNRLAQLRSPQKAKDLGRFFKTGPGEYGEGDVFWGLTVPQQRLVAKKFIDLPLVEIKRLLGDKVHEVRLTSLLILVSKFQKAGEKERQAIVDLYLKNTRFVNNWDLVDLSAPRILGAYLLDRDRSLLYKLAKSKNLWEKRISVLATFAFIREKQFRDSLKISEILLNDNHDLIHKAVGWMLREVGKQDQAIEEKFLKKHYRKMPRTMLRYAIERFEEKKRQFYLKKN
ncbi:DNA alkylation repair protein [Patescibacteria group bacterium]